MKPQKFFNHKFKASDGNVYDSRLEYHRYLYLLQLQQQGLISNLRRQVSFQVIPKQQVTIPQFGKRGQPIKPRVRVLEQPTHYTADFVYTLPDGRTVVEDTKSPVTRTKDYRIKRKLMLQVHRHRIYEVTRPTDPLPPADFFAGIV